MVSKMILASNDLGCSEEAITIAAVLSLQVCFLLSATSIKLISLHCILLLFDRIIQIAKDSISHISSFLLPIFLRPHEVDLVFNQGIRKGIG